MINLVVAQRNFRNADCTDNCVCKRYHFHDDLELACCGSPVHCCERATLDTPIVDMAMAFFWYHFMLFLLMQSAFCVFNYNIGPFTFVTGMRACTTVILAHYHHPCCVATVFSYVGGIYFFMRTVLNALVKCLFSIGYVAVHFLFKTMKSKPTRREPERVSVNDVPETKDLEERTPLTSSDPRVSLLGPLPHYFSSSRKASTTKYV